MTAALGAAPLAAFPAGSLIRGTRHAWPAPDVDPAASAPICLVPVPLGKVREALTSCS